MLTARRLGQSFWLASLGSHSPLHSRSKALIGVTDRPLTSAQLCKVPEFCDFSGAWVHGSLSKKNQARIEPGGVVGWVTFQAYFFKYTVNSEYAPSPVFFLLGPFLSGI
jgi:hypothetical protein